jgi:hypothetical protein
VFGQGTHRAESRLHLHPDVHVQQDGERIHLRRGEDRCRIDVVTGEIGWEKGWYCPHFGVRHRICVLVMRDEGRGPLRCGYRFRY